MEVEGVGKMRSVMLSIKPKYCELIASGQKTIEVRKTRPNIDTPFKCYIYCTKEKYIGRFLHTSDKNGCLLFWLNENDCTIFRYPENTSYTAYTCNGKVIGEFVCDEIIVDKTFGHNDLFNAAACLSVAEAAAYCINKEIYGWHISELVIYDKPKVLSKFTNKSSQFTFSKDGALVYKGLKRPPQSWCYVEEKVK